MKKLKIIATGVFLSVCVAQSFAQEKLPLNEPDYNKPKLFSDLPKKMNLRVADMDLLFRFSIGDAIRVKATENFSLEGTVVSKSEEASVRSVVIRSSNRQGAIFTFTKTTAADGSVNYLGRMLNRNNGDAFEIVKENGQYVLLKKNLYDLIAE